MFGDFLPMKTLCDSYQKEFALNLISVQSWTNLIFCALSFSNNNRSSCFSCHHHFPTSLLQLFLSRSSFSNLVPMVSSPPPSPSPSPPPPRAEEVMGTRLFCFSNLFCFTLLLRKGAVCLDTVLYGRVRF